MSTITIYASCHCKTFSTSFDIPASAFPLKSCLCHCNSCRHSTGHMFGAYAVIPLPYARAPPTTGLRGYLSSGKLTRWFCETCGARCWNDDRTAGDEEGNWEWEISVGLVDKVEIDGQVRPEIMEGLLDRVQMWLEDTADGGSSIWLNEGSVIGMDRRMTGRHSQVVGDEMLEEMKKMVLHNSTAEEPSKNILHAKCHCQAVKISISAPEPGQKYKAGLDACESCRKVTGSEITAWVAMPVSSIQFADGKPLDPQAKQFGRYSTSQDVFRIFCTTCGATVFYWMQQSTTIDVAVGLIRTVGARVEDWLKWDKYGTQHVAFVEDSVDKSFVDGLVLGFKKLGYQT